METLKSIQLSKDWLCFFRRCSFLGQVNHLLNIAVSPRTFVVVSKCSLFTIKEKGTALIEGLVLFGWNENRCKQIEF